MRDVLDADQAAARLGVPVIKLRALIRSGELYAQRRADRWFVPVAEVRRLEGLPRPNGRPYSAQAAWPLLALLSGERPSGLSAPRLSQLRRHLRESDPVELAGRLRHRARRQLVFVHPSQLELLAGDPRVVPSGWGVAEQAGVPLLAADDVPMELYIAQRDLAAVREQYLIADADEAANAVLRVVGDRIAVPQVDGVAAAPVVALDLLEAGDPRAVEAARQMFARLVQAYRGR
ncbi:MAG: helix-turn-helix domain-containing protein [Nitriliruptor sp.]|uniref:helix-turn-helix domain-containing protein n=1 Tax=Nitriliruptor sp. TaxID=2448056 RepID=UPI0034A00DD8